MNSRVHTSIRIFFALVAFAAVLVSSAFRFVDAGRANNLLTTRVYVPVTMGRPELPLLNGDFEKGRTDWSESTTKGEIMVIDITSPGYKDIALPVHSGHWIAWLGGEHNETSIISQTVSINKGRPYFTYWHYIVSTESCGSEKDIARVLVNNSAISTYDLCKSTQTAGWKKVFVDLSGYAGKDVVVAISAVTDGSENSNLFIDDVSFTSGPNATALEEEITEEPGVELNAVTKDEVLVP